ncbi:MAG: hypothetical protein AB1404_07025 [Spirochaetota bacterium]
MKVVGTSLLGPGARWRPATVPGGGGTTMGIWGPHGCACQDPE